jgi:hypothetical protein
MKKIISLLLSVLFVSNIALAEDASINSLKEEVSDKLNSTVSVLKSYFKKTNEKLIENKVSVDTAKETAQALKESSLEKETNPVVLKHGTASMPNCDTSIEELAWNGDNWACVKPSYGTDCYPAKDEYRYEEDGKIICSKSPQGESLNYYWKFRGHGFDCNTDAQKEKVYGCYYTNKLGAEVEVLDINCNGKSKPSADESICYANWQVGGFGSCSVSCGPGTQTREVSCPANHICADSQPASTQSCQNTCYANWQVGSWSKGSCVGPWYTKTRSVTCPANYVCSGSKPSSTSQEWVDQCTGGKSGGR